MAYRTALAGVLTNMSRLCVSQMTMTTVVRTPLQCGRCIHTQSTPLLFQATSQLWGSPMKKKKKMDPAVLLARENKRKKKIEKQMKRLERFGRRLKPVDEIDGDPKIQKEVEMRKRGTIELSFEEEERRALLQKAWSRLKMRENKRESQVWAVVMQSQQEALDQLRAESEELYQMAIQLDETLIPLEFKGPTATPPVKGYQPPDGDYIDTTKTFD